MRGHCAADTNHCRVNVLNELQVGSDVFPVLLGVQCGQLMDVGRSLILQRRQLVIDCNQFVLAHDRPAKPLVAARFVENEKDLDAVRCVSEADLKEMGLPIGPILSRGTI